MKNEKKEMFVSVTPDIDLIKYVMNEMLNIFERLSSASKSRLSLHMAIMAALQNHFVGAHLTLTDLMDIPTDTALANFDGMYHDARERFVKELAEIGLPKTNETDPYKH